MVWKQFVTNRHRAFVAGAYLKADPGPFILVERLNQVSGRVYFESSDNGIGALAFETDAPKAENLFFAYPQPSPNGVYVSTEDFFISSHPLDHLEEVTPCLSRDGMGVTGLILHFPDGHLVSVGGVRFDSLGSRFTVAGTSWFLAFSKEAESIPVRSQGRDSPAGSDRRCAACSRGA